MFQRQFKHKRMPGHRDEVSAIHFFVYSIIINCFGSFALTEMSDQRKRQNTVWFFKITLLLTIYIPVVKPIVSCYKTRYRFIPVFIQMITQSKNYSESLINSTCKQIGTIEYHMDDSQKSATIDCLSFTRICRVIKVQRVAKTKN